LGPAALGVAEGPAEVPAEASGLRPVCRVLSA